MTHPPPPSTLFPYTTLFRSSFISGRLATKSNQIKQLIRNGRSCLIRSEERFSRNAETDLVCRLLLEKKKNVNRSPKSSDVEAAACATTTGCMRTVRHVTPVPARIRDVFAAIAPSTAQTNGEWPWSDSHG